MIRHGRFVRVVGWLLSGVAVLGISGINCNDLASLWPGDSMPWSVVTVELVNTTDYPIDPRIFVDPDEHIWLPGTLINDDNWVEIDPPIEPGQMVSFTIQCDDIGTIASDHALMLVPDSQEIASDNGPWVVEEDEFSCYDTITFIFVDEPGGDFFTRVEVNGQFLKD